MTLHQLTALKDSDNPEDKFRLELIRKDKARADKMLKEILSLIPPSSSSIRISAATKVL